MKKNILTITILFFFLNSGFSQRAAFLGGEFAITGDVYDIIDSCGLITTTPLITGSWGITIGQEINKNFTVETGIIRKYYNSGFRYTTSSFATGSSSNAFNTWQIPFRLRARLNLLKNRLFLTTTIGYHFSINSDYGYGGGMGGGSLADGNDTIVVSYTVNDSIAKTFSLLEAGVGFEFAVSDAFIISLSSSYYTGLKNVYQMDMTTEGCGCISDNAFGISKGGYWNISVGIKYSISKFWKRK